MPHESTVAHEQRFVADSPMFSRSRQASVLDGKEVEPCVPSAKTKVLERSQSLLPHVRPETPRKVTHHHDEDDSEEESDKSA
jgi:5'-nucleotidase